MASVGGDSLPPTSSLVAAAFGSLVTTPVYTSQEYQALLRQDPDMEESAQKLDMAQMYEHTLVWGQLGDESRGGGARYGSKYSSLLVSTAHLMHTELHIYIIYMYMHDYKTRLFDVYST